MKVAVVVCTYNRAASLRVTLEALARQVTTRTALEILVVDNNSTDDTKAVVTVSQTHSNVPVHYLFEPRQGLSYARNAAASNAQSDVLIFIDDDASPARPDWAERLATAFSDPSIGAAGGDALPEWPAGGRPPWLHDQLLKYLGVVTFSERTLSDLQYPHFPYGVNLAVRRQTLLNAGGFSTTLGRAGNQLLSGEEIELCKRIVDTGLRVVYVPDAPVLHRMAPHRLTKDWFLSRARSQGQSKAMIELTSASAASFTIHIAKRIAILTLSALAAGAAYLINAHGWVMVARCKTAMSVAYLRHAFATRRHAQNELR
jgi:glycosyltransferase involved in cell wall biosynthesis